MAWTLFKASWGHFSNQIPSISTWYFSPSIGVFSLLSTLPFLVQNIKNNVTNKAWKKVIESLFGMRHVFCPYGIWMWIWSEPWLAVTSKRIAQCCISSRYVWHQFTGPGGMIGLVDSGRAWTRNICSRCKRQPAHATTTPNANAFLARLPKFLRQSISRTG